MYFAFESPFAILVTESKPVFLIKITILIRTKKLFFGEKTWRVSVDKYALL